MEQKYIEQIYKKYFADIYRYCLFKTSSKEEAEDIASNTFVKLLEYKGEAIINNKAWLITVARNQIYKNYMKTAKEAKVDNEAVENISDNVEIEDKVVDKELVEQAKLELRKLNDEEQDVVVLKIWEELKFDEIAEVVGRKVNTVKFIYYQALEKLKVAMGERKHSKKLYVLTAPLLAGAIKETSSYYLPNTEVVERVFSNLVIKINTMTESATITSKGILSSMSPKLVGIIAAAVIGGTGLGVGTTVVLTKTAPTPTPVVTVAPTVETTVKPTKVTTTKPQDTVVPTPSTVTIAFEKTGMSIPVENHRFTFTLINKGYSTEIIKQNGNAHHLKVSGNGFVLTLNPDFEAGPGFKYGNKQETKEINNTSLGKSYRVPAPADSEGLAGYYYGSYYYEGSECSFWQPQPVACASYWIPRELSTLIAHCTADAKNVYKCDEIIQSIIYKEEKI